jgi:hypothetical protein
MIGNYPNIQINYVKNQKPILYSYSNASSDFDVKKNTQKVEIFNWTLDEIVEYFEDNLS